MNMKKTFTIFNADVTLPYDYVAISIITLKKTQKYDTLSKIAHISSLLLEI